MIHDKLSTLWSYLSFSYLIGNSDLHLKNLSLIERRHGGYVLSLFYVLLSSTIATDDPDDFALMVNGKNRHLRKKDFLALAKTSGIGEGRALKKIGGLVCSAERFFDIIDDTFLDDSQRLKLTDIIKDRFEVLM